MQSISKQYRNGCLPRTCLRPASDHSAEEPDGPEWVAALQLAAVRINMCAAVIQEVNTRWSRTAARGAQPEEEERTDAAS